MVATTLVATAAGAVVNAVLVAVAWRYRREPGGRWFTAMAALMAASAAVYTVALGVRDPFVRHLLEAAFWAGALQIGVLWVGFALAYTGRGSVLRNGGTSALFAVGTAGGVWILTDPFHGTLLGGFAVTTNANVAAVAFSPGPALFTTLALLGVLIGGAWLMLADTLADAGPIFRRQTVALAVTPLFPIAAALLFVFDAGPAAGVNLVAVSYAPHAALDLYALYSGELFELDPATRRVGSRAAVASVGVPVVTVDTDGRVVAVADPTGAVFDRREAALVGEPLNDHLSVSIDPAGDPGVVELDTPDGVGSFRVRAAPFADGDRTLGYTVVFQDVTDMIACERRLSVLNRVLRHNLRNDLNVIAGHAELLADGDGGSPEAIRDRARRLMSISERARELDRAVESVDPSEVVAVGDLVRKAAAAVDADGVTAAESTSAAAGNTSAVSGEDAPATHDRGATGPDRDAPNTAGRAATAATDGAPAPAVCDPDGVRVQTDRAVLRIVVSNLIANAVEHAGSVPTVTVGADDDQAVISVSDDGPGIPETEVRVLDESVETALEHGSGLGLWVVQSGVAALGGSVSFDGTDGTTVTLRLPGLITDDADDADDVSPPGPT